MYGQTQVWAKAEELGAVFNMFLVPEQLYQARGPGSHTPQPHIHPLGDHHSCA